jgi:hypothetical protein
VQTRPWRLRKKREICLELRIASLGPLRTGGGFDDALGHERICQQQDTAVRNSIIG